MSIRLSSFAIYKQEFPEETTFPYKILESYHCLDGIRSRICEGRFGTLEEAMTHLKVRNVQK